MPVSANINRNLKRLSSTVPPSSRDERLEEALRPYSIADDIECMNVAVYHQVSLEDSIDNIGFSDELNK